MYNTKSRYDTNGDLLGRNEYQRYDGSYEYRKSGEKSIYAPDLQTLRKRVSEKNAISGTDTVFQQLAAQTTFRRNRDDLSQKLTAKSTVSDLLAVYMDSNRTIKESSKKTYGSLIGSIGQIIGSALIGEIQESHAIIFFDYLCDVKKVKLSSLKMYQSILRSAFGYAVSENILAENPFALKLSELYKNDAETRRPLDMDELSFYLNLIRNESWYAEVVLLAETGMRVGELYGLTLDNLDWETNRIHICKQVVRVQNRLTVSTLKTASSDRIIPMTATARNILDGIITVRPMEADSISVDGYSGFLFFSRASHPKMAATLATQMFTFRKRHTDLFPENFPAVSPHVLRHTYATRLEQSGIPYESISYLLGHSNLNTTTIYTHSSQKAALKAMEQISSISNAFL